MNDYEEITIPKEIKERIISIAKRLNSIKINKKQWDRLECLLISIDGYTDIYTNER